MPPDTEDPVDLLARQLEEHGPCGTDVDAGARTDLARALALPRSVASVLDESNNLTHRVSIYRAAAEDLCFFVDVRADVLAVDFDNDDAVRRAHRLYVVLRAAGHSPVLVASGRNGPRHVLCLLPPHERAAVIEEAGLTGMEVRSTIRPPLAAHRGGEPVRLLLPAAPADALARLEGRPPRRALGARALRALRRTTTPSGKSVSEVIFSLAMGAANAGWSVEEFLLAVATPGFGIQQLFAARAARRGVRRPLDWARNEVWPKAVAEVTASPARHQGPTARTVALTHWALTRRWPGRAGATDRAVYLALLRKLVLSGAPRFHASRRELCLLAGISSKGTVEKALLRLVDGGLVRCHPRVRVGGPSGGRLSNAWEPLNPGADELPTADIRSLTALDLLGDDAFRNRVGLGKSAEHLYVVIACWSGKSTGDLIEIAHRPPRWVREQLRTLRELGLVEQDPHGGWVRGQVMSEVVAKELGAAGRRDRQLQQFDRERDLFDRPPDRSGGRERRPPAFRTPGRDPTWDTSP